MFSLIIIEETTMNSEIVIDEGTELSIAAAQFLEDLKYGRQKVTFGSETKTVVIKESKLINKKLIISFVAICFLVFYGMFEFSKPLVTGFVTNNNQANRKKFDNSTLLFYSCEDQSVYRCKTDKEGDFSIRLPKGLYRVSSIVSGKEIKSPFKLDCVESIRVRVFIPYY